jgi:hypothetical protein
MDLRAPHGRERGEIGRRKPRAREREKREGETPCRLSALSLLPSKFASLSTTQGTFERAREGEGKRERVSERGREGERERGREGERERGREGERERGERTFLLGQNLHRSFLNQIKSKENPSLHVGEALHVTE